MGTRAETCETAEQLQRRVEQLKVNGYSEVATTTPQLLPKGCYFVEIVATNAERFDGKKAWRVTWWVQTV